MKDDYSRSVSLRCSTCGGSDFEFQDESGPLRCTGCDRIYSRDELISENGGRIDAEVEEVKAELFADISKDFSKMFKGFK